MQNSKPEKLKQTLTGYIAQAVYPVVFLGEVFSAKPRLARRKRELLYYLDLCGVKSLPVVIIISLLMGSIIAMQGILQMRKVGAEIFIVDLVGFAVLKEFGPLMVAMISTGRAGSAFAAEIGTMKVNEEIYALQTMGVNPYSYLVYPKLAAMLVAIPVLTVFGDAFSILGGMILSTSACDITPAAYWARSTAVLNGTVFMLGIIKSAVFGVLITLAGCCCGFSAEGNAQGVGRGATQAVVASIFLVVIADAVMTLLFTFIGY
ncbi:MAG: ABC transporter permease [Lentisphaeria bacterium]|nr:ABC transporter permease [Lentisphaeria bacterium]